MWNFIGSTGLAPSVLDFTHDFSPLLVGLVGMVWLSAGLIVWATIHHYMIRQPETGWEAPAPAEDLRDAA